MNVNQHNTKPTSVSRGFSAAAPSPTPSNKGKEATSPGEMVERDIANPAPEHSRRRSDEANARKRKQGVLRAEEIFLGPFLEAVEVARFGREKAGSTGPEKTKPKKTATPPKRINWNLIAKRERDVLKECIGANAVHLCKAPPGGNVDILLDAMLKGSPRESSVAACEICSIDHLEWVEEMNGAMLEDLPNETTKERSKRRRRVRTALANERKAGNLDLELQRAQELICRFGGEGAKADDAKSGGSERAKEANRKGVEVDVARGVDNDCLLAKIASLEVEHKRELSRMETETEELKIEHNEELGRVEMERDAAEERLSEQSERLMTRIEELEMELQKFARAGALRDT